MRSASLASLTYVILLAVGAAMFPPTAAITYAAESESQIRERLHGARNEALATVSAKGDAEGAFDEVIARGARRLAADGAGEEEIRAAEANLKRLVQAAGRNGIVTERSVKSALSICPLYPFC